MYRIHLMEQKSKGTQADFRSVQLGCKPAKEREQLSLWLTNPYI